MKQSFHFIFLVIINICVFHFVKVNSTNMPLIGKTIYLDAGHGGL